jgi:diguanylate cyclase (GGDEF)-like protein/PAS domain S-box-containing protein
MRVHETRPLPGDIEMASPIRILHAEDTPIDAELAMRVLRKAGMELQVQRVEREEAFLRALAELQPDVILCDYSMPHIDGATVLGLALAHAPDVPFIFLSGTIGEEIAIDSLKRGATDYILKTNMSRLPAAIQRAINDARERASRRRAQRELQEAQERFALFMQHLPGPAFIKDSDGRYQFVNAAFERCSGRVTADVLGRTDHDLWPAFAPSYTSNDRWVFENGQVLQTFEMLPQDDAVHSYLVHKFPIPGPDARPPLIGAVAVDFTARLEAEQKLARLSRIHAFLSGLNAATVRTSNGEELLREVCRIAVEHGAFRAAWIAVFHPAGPQLVASEGIDALALQQQLEGPATPGNEAAAAHAAAETGAPKVAELTLAGDADAPDAQEARAIAALPIRMDGNTPGALVLHADTSRVFERDEMKLLTELAGDISFALDYLAKKARLDYFAYYDALTGLPNRALCADRIDQAVRAHLADGAVAAIVVVDVERFSFVNDSLGRQAGDELLRQIAKRLQEMMARRGSVARAGADTFAVVLPDVRDDADVARWLQEGLATALAAPFTLAGQELRIAFKSGVALVPADGTEGEALLRHAETALKSAKGGGERYLFYAAPMNERVAEILALENALRAGLAGNEFVLHYQPKMDLAKGRMYGVEALLRWNSPRRGMVPPGTFLQVAEKTGLILDIGLWALRQAARDQVRLAARAQDGMRMSVNVSALQLRQKAFVEDLLAAIREVGGDPAAIDLEITESVIMEDIECHISKLQSLRALGMGVEIDDFGTGYSSLAYLTRLPATALKIDRAFVTGMMASTAGRMMISTIISLGHALHLPVIAEGVESVEQRDCLRGLDCHYMQGYLFGKPMPLDDLYPLLRPRGTQDEQH